MEDLGAWSRVLIRSLGTLQIALAAAGAGPDLAVECLEQAAEAAPEGVQGGQNRNGDAGGDQCVLNGCRTRLVPEEARKHGPHVDSPVLALLGFSRVRCLTCSAARTLGERANTAR